MTSPEQKERERSVLNFYLRIAGLDGEVRDQESPDFVVTVGSRRIGVEITEYHQPTHSGGRFPRTQVEAEWDRINAAVEKYRATHSGLENLSVRLEFTNLRVPSVDKHHDFIQAIHHEIECVKSDLGDRRTTIRVDDRRPAVLCRYLKQIHVRVVRCCMEWDWNHSFGGVGTSDNELLSILSPKFSLKRAEDVDELHLVVAGDGRTVGTYIGYLDPGRLDSFNRLNAALDRSNYDVVAIVNYEETCMRRKYQGWSLFRHSDLVHGK
jgi:hypothetical protein